MPVRSLSSSSMRWPARDEVHAAAARWARRLAQSEPSVLAVGYFGSYARGEAGVGSDLDVIVIVSGPDVPDRSGEVWSLEQLPVPADLLVYTQAQWSQLAERNGRFYRVLRAETVWLTDAPPLLG